MIKDLLRKSPKSMSKSILEASIELGKFYSKIELATSKLEKRDQNLLDACSHQLIKGSKDRAAVLANEISEIRKVLSILQRTQLIVEQAILRLDTVKTVTPTLENIQAVFSDVKTAMAAVVDFMPSISEEMGRLGGVIDQILIGTEFNLEMPAPPIVENMATEAILKEASNIAERNLESKIPEPPAEIKMRRSTIVERPLVALVSNNGLNPYSIEENPYPMDINKSDKYEVSSFILEALMLDYVERLQGDINIGRCAAELNISKDRAYEALLSLKQKGKITLAQ